MSVPLQGQEGPCQKRVVGVISRLEHRHCFPLERCAHAHAHTHTRAHAHARAHTHRSVVTTADLIVRLKKSLGAVSSLGKWEDWNLGIRNKSPLDIRGHWTRIWRLLTL